MHSQIEPIYRTIQFIECHLSEEITVGQMADAAGYSVFHFIRTFNQIVHLTPCDYLMRRRLTEAAQRLVNSNWRIIDIAQDFCFNSQEGFTRVFKKMFHITPGQVQKKKNIVIYDQMPAKTMEDLRYLNSRRFQPPKLVNEENIFLKGLMTVLDTDDEIQRQQRDHLKQDLTLLTGFNPENGMYEVFTSSGIHWENQYFFAGFKGSELEMESANLVDKTIPAGLYAIINAVEEDRSLALRYVHSTWVPSSGLTTVRNMEIVKQNKQSNIRKILIPVERVSD